MLGTGKPRRCWSPGSGPGRTSKLHDFMPSGPRTNLPGRTLSLTVLWYHKGNQDKSSAPGPSADCSAEMRTVLGSVSPVGSNLAQPHGCPRKFPGEPRLGRVKNHILGRSAKPTSWLMMSLSCSGIPQALQQRAGRFIWKEQLQLQQGTGKRKETQHQFTFSKILALPWHTCGWEDNTQGQVRSGSSTAVSEQCPEEAHQPPPSRALQEPARLVLTKDKLRTHADPTASREESVKEQTMLCANWIFRWTPTNSCSVCLE